MPNIALTSKTKRALSFPLQQWLKQNHNGERRFSDAGISEGNLRNIRMGRCTDNFLFQFQKELETITGLSIDRLCVDAAKQELWSRGDKFPQITTREGLISELRKMAQNRLHEIKDILRSDGTPRHFERDMADPSKLWVTRVTNAFRALEYLCGGKSGQGAQGSGGFKFVIEDEPLSGRSSSERTVDSIISILNSLANMTDANIDRDSVSENAKINAASAMARMLEKIGVTLATLKAFEENRGGTDTTNLKHVLNILGRK